MYGNNKAQLFVCADYDSEKKEKEKMKASSVQGLRILSSRIEMTNTPRNCSPGRYVATPKIFD
jgi:hypothetical protein